MTPPGLPSLLDLTSERSKMARVLVAEDEVLIRVDIVETLEEAGHSVVGEASDGEQAIRLARELTPDLVVMDVKMPKLDGLAAEAGTIGYLVKPFQPAQLLAGVGVALARAADRRKLQDTVEDLESKLANRKVIERAKGRLMEQFALTEDEAYTRMRRAAMDRQLPLVEVARRILDAPQGG